MAFDHLWKTRDHHWVEVVRACGASHWGQRCTPRAAHPGRRGDAARHTVIVGEPRSGKEFLARLLHQRQYPRGPFVRLYCAAVSDQELKQVFGDRASLSTLLRHMDDTDLDNDIEAGATSGRTGKAFDASAARLYQAHERLWAPGMARRGTAADARHGGDAPERLAGFRDRGSAGRAAAGVCHLDPDDDPCATVLRIFHCWQSITCAARRANMARFPRNCTLRRYRR